MLLSIALFERRWPLIRRWRRGEPWRRGELWRGEREPCGERTLWGEVPFCREDDRCPKWGSGAESDLTGDRRVVNETHECWVIIGYSKKLSGMLTWTRSPFEKSKNSRIGCKMSSYTFFLFCFVVVVVGFFFVKGEVKGTSWSLQRQLSLSLSLTLIYKICTNDLRFFFFFYI